MLVGREPERKLVERLAAAARLGESGVLVVAGEAGIGKSALLEHAASLCEGMIVHRVVGSEVERDLAFGGLSQLLAGAVDELDQLPDPQAHALGVALAVPTGTAVDRFAVAAATLGMLTGSPRPSPALCSSTTHISWTDPRPRRSRLSRVDWSPTRCCSWPPSGATNPLRSWTLASRSWS